MKEATPHQRVAVIASLGSSLTNFRLELLKSMVANGHEVCALSPDIDSKTAETLDKIGVSHREVPMARTGINPFDDLRTVRALTAELRAFGPDVVLPYTMKPIIYGNLAARRAGASRRYALFTGLGYTFSEENPKGKRAFVQAVAVQLYRMALQGLDAAFVYNPDEEADIRRFRLIPDAVPIIQVPGSGVDLTHFDEHRLPDGKVKFLMISRLLKSKGIDVYVEAARRLKEGGITAEVQLLGPLDPNPDAYDEVDVKAWQDDGILNYLGATKDVRPFIREATVIVLPAVHREGIPRTVLEGMSMRRPIITTDVPGCVHSIVDGESGFIVPAGDAKALAAAMRKFVEEPELADSMGRSARKRAESVFDVRKVNRILLTQMGLEGQLQ